MNNIGNKNSNNPLVKVFNSLFSRLTQSPDVYPIKFYMKAKRQRRSRYVYLAN